MLRAQQNKGVITMKNNEMKSMNMTEAKAALEATVSSYNSTTDVSERTRLEIEGKDLATKYNALSLLTAYAGIMSAEKPVVAIAKAYSYPTISFKLNVADALVEGKAKKVKVASIEDGTKTHNLYDFMDWAAKHNKKVAADGGWKTKAEAARCVINDEWKKYMESDDGYKMSKSAVKKAVQAMFDALVFIPCENNEKLNAVIATGNIANYLIALAAKNKIAIEDGKVNFKVDFMSANNWKSKAFDVLHMAVENKTFEVVYGDPEEAINTAAVESNDAEAATEAEAE
jgi:hypothetical protein